ncbi:unnamed protein product, partial [Ixodes hexagonus]
MRYFTSRNIGAQSLYRRLHTGKMWASTDAHKYGFSRVTEEYQRNIFVGLIGTFISTVQAFLAEGRQRLQVDIYSHVKISLMHHLLSVSEVKLATYTVSTNN